MGSRNTPHLYIYIKKIMKIEKILIKESVGINKNDPQTFSSKKQNIVITESQLEKLLEKLKK
jgi:hypothetical protein